MLICLTHLPPNHPPKNQGHLTLNQAGELFFNDKLLALDEVIQTLKQKYPHKSLYLLSCRPMNVSLMAKSSAY